MMKTKRPQKKCHRQCDGEGQPASVLWHCERDRVPIFTHCETLDFPLRTFGGRWRNAKSCGRLRSIPKGEEGLRHIYGPALMRRKANSAKHANACGQHKAQKNITFVARGTPCSKSCGETGRRGRPRAEKCPRDILEVLGGVLGTRSVETLGQSASLVSDLAVRRQRTPSPRSGSPH